MFSSEVKLSVPHPLCFQTFWETLICLWELLLTESVFMWLMTTKMYVYAEQLTEDNNIRPFLKDSNITWCLLKIYEHYLNISEYLQRSPEPFQRFLKVIQRLLQISSRWFSKISRGFANILRNFKIVVRPSFIKIIMF